MTELFLETDETEILTAVFGADEANPRLDAALSSRFEGLSRNRAQELILQGDVHVNGNVVTSKKHKIGEGDEVEISMRLRKPLRVQPEPMPLTVLYEDDDLLVVDKPKGMVVHPAPGNASGTLVNGLLHHIGAANGGLSSVNGAVRPGIVHRIDKNTSGLLVVAKNDSAHDALASQLAEHTMTRRYIAIVAGSVKHDEGTVDASLTRDTKNRKKRRVMADGSGKRAVTHYRTLERFKGFSLIELRLETGRTHQIRAHMAYIGHPVLGDDLYGPADGTGQYLHAKTLGFIHPTSGTYMEFESEPPEDFRAMTEKLRKR
ncbi:MAG: RluA family pseudouridine synthase [Clostridiales Family XIII bacterium]|jgi:23S rRNA pseudouridine1911/1915/1917 synthase|nr:RluA family pseudouridine synthase [Clostridiales Family XIII bacterium]